VDWECLLIKQDDKSFMEQKENDEDGNQAEQIQHV
jgi:hypothetical protein